MMDVSETWKNIESYPGYSVSNLGRIRKDRNKQILKPFIVNGYEKIKLTNKFGRKAFRVHRLVLSTFKPCTDLTKDEVHHIDHNPKNNQLSNLTWVTRSKNMRELWNRRKAG